MLQNQAIAYCSQVKKAFHYNIENLCISQKMQLNSLIKCNFLPKILCGLQHLKTLH